MKSMISYAQSFEDVRLRRAFEGRDWGFYVDVGAMDPVADSVTKHFYDQGWRGINVEPVEQFWTQLVAQRPRDVSVRAAISDVSGESCFYYVPDTGLSSLRPEALNEAARLNVQPEVLRVPTLTLAELCARYASEPIDFLKVDVEGGELEVLRSGDWDRFRPLVVVVEAVKPNSQIPSHAEWEPVLTDNGYEFAVFDGLNRFYVAREAHGLIECLQAPPNIFDDFVQWRTVYAETELGRMYQERNQVQHRLDESERRRVTGLALLERQTNTIDGLQAERDRLMAYADRVRRRLETVSQRRVYGVVRQLAGWKWPELDLSDLTVEPDRIWAEMPESSQSVAGSRIAPAAHRAEVVDGEHTAPAAVRMFLDVSFLMSHAQERPDGLGRVERYVADFLVGDPGVDARFLVYDRQHSCYRRLTEAEQTLLEEILNRRNQIQSAMVPGEIHDAESEPMSPDGRLGRWRSRFKRVARMSPDEFGSVIAGYAARCLPVSANQPAAQRIATRGVRRLGLIAARRGHSGLLFAMRLRSGAARLASADSSDTRPSGEEAEEDLNVAQFGPGDVLVTMGNVWDYMDYRYLHRLCRYQGVRLVSVIYDVAAMELPFTSLWPPHIYQRYWIEAGHLSSHVLTISRQSTAMYQRYIAEPNDLTVSISHAYLPNFLKQHAASIGEIATPGLGGRPFVVYCSTIESRKNHQLLLHLWDRLRHELHPDRLPVLVFAGKWGWGTETVRLMVERNWRLRSHLRVLDRVSDAELIWLYRNARFTVFPSYAEGFGLGVAESLSFGTPAVVSNYPALIEASEGLMPAHSPYDFDAWYDEIRALATDDDRLAALQAAAAQYRGPPYDEFARALRDIARRLNTT